MFPQRNNLTSTEITILLQTGKFYMWKFPLYEKLLSPRPPDLTPLRDSKDLQH